MKRTLIYYPANKFSMTDFGRLDYVKVPDIVKKDFSGKFPNVGNKVWLQAIVSLITTDYCTYDFGYEDLSEDYINANYDCVLMPLANCFHQGWIPYMERRTSHIEKLKIPVYVIACGIQADSYDDLDDLAKSVKEPAYKFIKAVENSGGGTGRWALRGYLTQEFFTKLGFHDAVVTGCPSLYQMGRDLKIKPDVVEKEDFLATINGTFHLPLFDVDIENCKFIDQGSFGNLLFDPEYFIDNPYSFKKICKQIRRGEYRKIKAIAEDRIELFADTQEWMSFYTMNNISFSFGSRIHGTVMPILSGVKSLLYSQDARTREMAEFFDIPFIQSNDKKKKKTLFELYQETDYSGFNKMFPEKFDKFEMFLIECDLVKKANQKNIFMSRDRKDIMFPEHVNVKDVKQIKRKLPLAEVACRVLEKR